MPNYKVDELREILQDPRQFEELASFFINKSSEEHASNLKMPKIKYWPKVGLGIIPEENLRTVFRFAESPIEKIFVNAVFLNFIKNDPLNLFLLHSVKDAPSQIKEFRKNRAQFKKFKNWYLNKHGNMNGVQEYLKGELKSGKMEESEYAYLMRHLVLYEYLSLENSFHMILQPGMPDIKVAGLLIRPDFLIWVPLDKSIRIFVECDGFEYHKAKTSFVRDRQRDRKLKAAGYEVLRYSGTEIHSDPIGTANDLAEFLWSIEKSGAN